MSSQNLSRLSRIRWEKSIENQVEDWIWQPRIYSIWRMNSQILPRYSIEFSEKKWEIGVKIAYGNFGYYPQFTSFFFLKFTDQMENWGEDGIWELTVLATCGPNSQNLPRNSRIHWKKRKKCKVGLKIGFGNLGFIPLEGRILRIHPAFLEFIEKRNFFLKFVIFPLFFIFK